MSKGCTFYILIIPVLCLPICYSLTSAVKEEKEMLKKEETSRVGSKSFSPNF